MLTNHEAICYSSTWRALHDGGERPALYIMLSAKELAELIATGSYSLPDDVVPESVKQWRKTTEAAAEVVLQQLNPDPLEGIVEGIEKTRESYRERVGKPLNA